MKPIEKKLIQYKLKNLLIDNLSIQIKVKNRETKRYFPTPRIKIENNKRDGIYHIIYIRETNIAVFYINPNHIRQLSTDSIFKCLEYMIDKCIDIMFNG